MQHAYPPPKMLQEVMGALSIVAQFLQLLVNMCDRNKYINSCSRCSKALNGNIFDYQLL